MAAVGEGHIQVGLGVEIFDLPGPCAAARGGDAAAEADPQHQHQQKLAERVQQTFIADLSGRNKGTGKASRGVPPKIRTFFCPASSGSPWAEVEVLVETAGLGT